MWPNQQENAEILNGKLHLLYSVYRTAVPKNFTNSQKKNTCNGRNCRTFSVNFAKLVRNLRAIVSSNKNMFKDSSNNNRRTCQHRRKIPYKMQQKIPWDNIDVILMSFLSTITKLCLLYVSLSEVKKTKKIYSE